MSLKTLPTFIALAALATACGEKEEDTATEEPSSEPSTEDTEDTEVTYVLEVNSISWSFQTGMIDLQPSPYIIPTTEQSDGYLTLTLGGIAGDECNIIWMVNAETAVEDTRFAAGTVTNSSFGQAGEPETFTVWNGFTLNGTPEAYGCETLGEVTYTTSQGAVALDWAAELDAILAVQPSFGFGPLTDKLATALEGQDGFDASKTFTGFLSFPWASFGMDDNFLDMNIAFLYSMNSETLEVELDPQGTIPQGTEVDAAQANFADGFYFSYPVYSFQLTPQ